MATQVPAQSDPNLLVKVAEHLAIQFALERYEKGEVRVNAVRELLDRMGKEIEGLRGVLRAARREDGPGRPDGGVLLRGSRPPVLGGGAGEWQARRAAFARCVVHPSAQHPRLRPAIARTPGPEDCLAILDKYSSNIRSADVEARRRTAMGLSELAELYAQTGSRAATQRHRAHRGAIADRARHGIAEPARCDPGAAHAGSRQPLRIFGPSARRSIAPIGWPSTAPSWARTCAAGLPWKAGCTSS